jgi:Tfp pilus assembly protein PilN
MWVRVFDSISRSSRAGPNIHETLGDAFSGREAVVAVSQRSSFIRTVPVPNVAHDELEKVVALKLAPLIPLKPGEYVSAFRLAENRGVGKLAIAAAIKTESLRKIYDDCEKSGIRPLAVLPVAFGSWLAARANSLQTCVVVEADDDSLSLDVIGGGELRYSRALPLPESSAELEEEIVRTAGIAGVSSASVLGNAALAIADQHVLTLEPIEYLADIHAIERLLFSFELPERLAARRRKGRRGVAQRAIAAAIVGVASVAAAYWSYTNSTLTAANGYAQARKELTSAQSDQSAAAVANRQASESQALLNVGFRPSQTMSDVTTALAQLAPKSVWLTGLTLERGKPILVRGSTTSSKSVADFVSAINANPRFRNVKVVSATKGSIGKTTVIQFALVGRATGLLPIDQPISRDLVVRR